MQRRTFDVGPRVRRLQALVLLALALGIAVFGGLEVVRAPATAVVSAPP